MASISGTSRGLIGSEGASGVEERRRVAPVEVVTAARAGDDTALGRLGAASLRRLVAFYRYSGLPTPDAEDLASETVAVIITSLQRLRDAEAYESWMWAIGRNKLRGFLRRRSRPTRSEPPSPPASGPEDVLLLVEEHHGIRAALATLSQRDRDLLWLREVEGLSYDEIGGRLGATTGTIRVACHRARRRLEEAYRDTNGETDST